MPEEQAAEGEKARILVLADRTAESEELLEVLRSRAAERAVEFLLVVPPRPQGASRVGGPDPVETEREHEEADDHLHNALERLRAAGLEVEGKVGDPDPVAAAEDETNFAEFEEIVVSTPHTRVGKWLKVDLPHRVEGATGRPVTHVRAAEEDGD